jgi:hypothetical protein
MEGSRISVDGRKNRRETNAEIQFEGYFGRFDELGDIDRVVIHRVLAFLEFQSLKSTSV